MESRTYYYARVSSAGQNLDRQIDRFHELGADDRDIIIDKESGKDMNRTGYLALRNNLLREQDTLVITSLDRLSRNKQDIKSEIQYFKDKGIRLKVLDIPTTLIDVSEDQQWVMDMVQNILIEVLGSIAQNERETIHKRQAEGIASAKRRNVKFGRPVYQIPDNYTEIMEMVDRGILRPTEAMKKMNMSKSTYYKMRKQLR
ncbi:MAG: recombinase family protein [Lachnospiraceae bacterium]|nr:recombinase family protein [Lachnospiraceae bacterium]